MSRQTNMSSQINEYIKQHYKDMHYADIGKVFGISELAVRSRASRLKLSKLTHETYSEVEGEQWNNLAEYPQYDASDRGRVRRADTHKIIRQWVTNGYCRVQLYYNGVKNGVAVHRLVAMAFIPNPDNLPFINHKDENKMNNVVDNLEWCTMEYNINYGTGMQRRAEKMRGRRLSEGTKAKISKSHLGSVPWNKGVSGVQHLSQESRAAKVEILRGCNARRAVSVVCVETGEVFSSIAEAARSKHLAAPNVVKVISGQRSTCGGWHWTVVGTQA